MKSDMKSEIPSGEWRIDGQVRPELGSAFGEAEADSPANIYGPHRDGASAFRAMTSFLRPEAEPTDMIDAMPVRRFGLPSASTIGWSEGTWQSDRGYAAYAEESRVFPQGPSRRGLSRRALAFALCFIEENLEADFTLIDLAKAVGKSRSHFSRQFRQSTGESPMGYARRRRIARAKGMLLEGSCKTCEIASALGFFDQNHFTRTFRRITGLAPGEYVRMCEVAEVAV